MINQVVITQYHIALHNLCQAICENILLGTIYKAYVDISVILFVKESAAAVRTPTTLFQPPISDKRRIPYRTPYTQFQSPSRCTD